MSDLEKLLALDKELRWRDYRGDPPRRNGSYLCDDSESINVMYLRIDQETDCNVARWYESNHQGKNRPYYEPLKYMPLAPLLKYLEEKEK